MSAPKVEYRGPLITCEPAPEITFGFFEPSASPKASEWRGTVTRHRYLRAGLIEAEVASLRAQLAEATKQAETDRQHALRLFRDLHATSEERDALRSQLAEARAAAPRWVPVTERLPEFGETVLVPGGLAFLRASGGWYSLITDRPICWEVRHWMPLPSAPAPEER